MQVDPSAAGGQLSTTAVGPPDPANADSALASDFNTFLQLLTAQLNNQDPLNPVNSTEWVAQLASFSAVEQQTLTNDLLSEIAQNLSVSQNLTENAFLIGREAAIAGPVTFDGTGAIDFVLTPPTDAENAIIELRNDFGTPILRQTITAGDATFTWTGTTSDGQTAPAGRYTASVTYTPAEGDAKVLEARAFQTIEELRQTGLDVAVTTSSGNTALLAEITSLR